jgi:cardiolipin-specific phospholipase
MYSLDWLGMGRSGRPDPALLAPPKNAGMDERVANAEGFFVESLEAWRVKEGVDKMMLIGHSLGELPVACANCLG